MPRKQKFSKEDVIVFLAAGMITAPLSSQVIADLAGLSLEDTERVLTGSLAKYIEVRPEGGKDYYRAKGGVFLDLPKPEWNAEKIKELRGIICKRMDNHPLFA